MANHPIIIPVILAGGKGTRLWPLSRENYPKPLLKLLGEHSLLQSSLQIAQQINPKCLCIVSNHQHEFMIKQQVQELNMSREVNMILEPASRNTTASIALACANYLQKGQDYLLLVLPADHIIKNPDRFVQAVRVTADNMSENEIICFGVEPNTPHTGYGYIRIQTSLNKHLYKISEFIEKPDVNKATSLLAEDDVFWNCGIFMFRAQTYANECQRLKPMIWDCAKQSIKNAIDQNGATRVPLQDFESCEDISVDYAIMEQTQHGKMAIMPCQWSDIGTWYSLWEQSDKDENNNVLVGHNIITRHVKNSYIQSNKRCIAAIGIENQIIIETTDAILIVNKNHSHDVKSLVATLNESEINRELTKTHKLVHRPWGSFESLNKGPGFQVKRLLIKPNQSISLQLHHHRSEHWVVICGRGQIIKGNETFEIKKGESTFIPAKTLHKLSNHGDEVLEIIETQIGDYLEEDDIVRLEDKYGRVTKVEAKSKAKEAVTSTV